MIRWRTLNKGEAVEEVTNTEIRIENLLKVYQEALQIHQQGQRAEAKARYELILGNDIMTDEDVQEQTKGKSIDSSSLVMLRFLVFKNYASIIEDESKDPNITESTRDALMEKAMDYYLKVLMIDPSERSVWYRIGVLAYSLHNLRLARSSFEKGFYADVSLLQPSSTRKTTSLLITPPQSIERKAYSILGSTTLSPIQWNCLEGLCKVLYDIGDYTLCDIYVKLGLQRYNSWSLGKELSTKMACVAVPDNLQSLPVLEQQQEKEEDSMTINISSLKWQDLLSSLLGQHKQLLSQRNNAENDNLSSLFVNRMVSIHVDAVDVDESMEQDKPSDSPSAIIKQNLCSSDEQLQGGLQSSSTVSTATQEMLITQADTLPPTLNSPKSPIKQELDVGRILISIDGSGTDVSGQTTTSNVCLDDKLQQGNQSSTEMSTINESQEISHVPIDSKDRMVNDLTLSDNEGPTGSGTLKRKFEDGDTKNKDDGEKDDDDEREEKRTSLRASKRQKEKVECEEIWKKKMLKEEDELTGKVQRVFDTLGDLDDFRRNTPWYTPTRLNIAPSTLTSFWCYFDLKVAELGTNSTWNFEVWKSKDDVLSSVPSKKNQYFKFENLPSLSNSSQIDDLVTRRFIDSLNETNSGTRDALCLTVTALLQQVSNTSVTLDDTMATLLLDAAETLGRDLLTTIWYSSNHDESNWTKDDQRLQSMLYLAEKYVDRLISSIQAEQTMMSGTSLSSKQRLAMDKQTKMTKYHREQCDLWIGWLTHYLIVYSKNTFTPAVLMDASDAAPNPELITTKRILLRYWLLKGKLAQCNDDVDEAIRWYSKCDVLFDSDGAGQLDLSLPCTYDSIVNSTKIKEKLRLLETTKYLVKSQEQLVNRDYDGVLSQMENIISNRLRSVAMTSTNDVYIITSMLAKCYLKTNRYSEAWKCYSEMLTTLIVDLVMHGGSQMQNDKIPVKGDDTMFFKLLCSVDSVIDDCIYLLSDTVCEDWLPGTLETDFVDSLMILLRTTIVYTFRHPDFIPLVNNFSNPDVKPHVPSKKTKSNSYNDVNAKTWVLISTLIQQKTMKSNDRDRMTSLASLLQNVHDELGEREVCGVSKGIFLEYLMQVLNITDANANRRGIYQCYHCLYGVHLAAEAEPIEEHHADHGDLTVAAAERLYRLVIDDILAKIDRNAPLKNDLKDAIETVSPLFEELPENNSYVQRNRAIIEGYLERQVNINQPIKSMLRQCDLPIDSMNSSSSSRSLSVIFSHIFMIRGKVLRTHIKNRPKGSSDKTMTDLEEAIEQFKCHVILHPTDQQGWFELASTLMQLAEEELTWSAVNILTHRKQIITYQRAAFHSFLKSWQLYNCGHRLKKDQLFGFFTSFGSLVYSMTCTPMEMAAFEITQPKKALDKSGNLRNLQPIKPKASVAYRLSLDLLCQSLNYKSSDHSEWKTLYTVGKCYHNLGRPGKEVLDWYIRSIKQFRDQGLNVNVSLEPLYKLYSTLVKYLYSDFIEPTDVVYYLDQVSAIQSNSSSITATSSSGQAISSKPLPLTVGGQGPFTDIVEVATDSSSRQEDPEEGQSWQSKQQNSEVTIDKSKAFDLIFDKLCELRKGDKKHWHHRPVYKIAWMCHKIYHDAQRAKAELLHLFTLKQVNKGLVNIWRPELERPGKHFVFIRQYVMFLIELAKETNDLESLNNLCRKLKRAGTSLLDEAEAFQKALDTYLDVFEEGMLRPRQGPQKRQQIITGPIDKEKFDALSQQLGKELTLRTTPPITEYPDMLSSLHDLQDLRRYATGFVPTDRLDVTIQECYSILLFEQTAIDTLLSKGSPSTGLVLASTTRSDDTSLDDGTDVSASVKSGNEMDVDCQGIQGTALSSRARSLINLVYGNVKT